MPFALQLPGGSQAHDACAQNSDTLKKVADNKKITVAYRESSVPFSYLAGTAPVGFSVESPTPWSRR
jgi:ABC-type amino acid transport substrate-binding protein